MFLLLLAAGASLLLVLMVVVPEWRQIMLFSAPPASKLVLGMAVRIAAGSWSGLRMLFIRDGAGAMARGTR